MISKWKVNYQRAREQGRLLGRSSEKAPHLAPPKRSAKPKKSLAPHLQRSDTIRRRLLIVFIEYNEKLAPHLSLLRPGYLPILGGALKNFRACKNPQRPPHSKSCRRPCSDSSSQLEEKFTLLIFTMSFSI